MRARSPSRLEMIFCIWLRLCRWSSRARGIDLIKTPALLAVVSRLRAGVYMSGIRFAKSIEERRALCV